MIEDLIDVEDAKLALKEYERKEVVSLEEIEDRLNKDTSHFEK
jgi:hypothetical protein